MHPRTRRFAPSNINEQALVSCRVRLFRKNFNDSRMSKSSKRKPVIIGRMTTMQFIEWPGRPTVVAKVDTGAYTGAIHAVEIREGKRHVYFRPFSWENDLLKTSQFRKKRIKSSNGITEERIVIETTVTAQSMTFDCKLTLANRTSMKTPVLLGRFNLAGTLRLQKGRFLVDVRQTVPKELLPKPKDREKGSV